MVLTNKDIMIAEKLIRKCSTMQLLLWTTRLTDELIYRTQKAKKDAEPVGTLRFKKGDG